MNKSATNISHFIDLKQVFQLALNDAPFNFGYQLIEKKVQFYRYIFYAYLIGYKNDDVLGIHLYKSDHHNTIPLDTSKNKNQLYKMLHLILSIYKNKKSLAISLSIDPSLNDIEIDENAFIKMLSRIFDSLSDSSKLKVQVLIKIGEWLLVNKKRHRILQIKLSSDTERFTSDDLAIENDLLRFFSYHRLDTKEVVLELPIPLSKKI